jgi:hypothetical protein
LPAGEIDPNRRVCSKAPDFRSSPKVCFQLVLKRLWESVREIQKYHNGGSQKAILFSDAALSLIFDGLKHRAFPAPPLWFAALLFCHFLWLPFGAGLSA